MNKTIGTHTRIEPLIDLIKLQINTEFSSCTPGKERDLQLNFSISKDKEGKLEFIKVKKG